jgi:cbb3-type cytochrome oxidase subunit 3
MVVTPNDTDMNFENGNKEFGQTFSKQKNTMPVATQTLVDQAPPAQNATFASRVMRPLMFMIQTLCTWVLVAITLFILGITWLVTIREKKDLTDKDRQKKLLLIISE